MRLSELQPGHSAIIVKTLGHGAFRRRLVEMGFVRGHRVTALLEAPLRDPIKYKVMDYEVSLRVSEAELVIVEPIGDDVESVAIEPGGDEVLERVASPGARRTINVALIGNPNCGKTSLFNMASGAHEHTGNYSGVTVDAKEGSLTHRGYRMNIVDLPGTYSLTSYSPEELYVRRFLANETPDVIINVVVASNISRNLYLTTELIDMDRSMVIALNMIDELERSGDVLDYETLGEMIGVPVVPTSARTGRGISELLDRVIEVYEERDKAVRHVHVQLGTEIERSVNLIKDAIKLDHDIDRRFAPRYLAIKLLEGDSEIENLLSRNPDYPRIKLLRDEQAGRLSAILDEDPATAITNEKYGFIQGALAETMTRSGRETETTTRIIDAFVTNRLFGFPFFIAVMFVIFWATFYLGAYPMDWIEAAVAWIGEGVQRFMPDGVIKDLVADGVIGGVGGVIVFLPNILILYFCISFMEDSGYMARAAFIMDRLMHRIGLHGKSFIPLIMGFGCNVPAIMASRSIESPSSRIITILINPFMSCSARIPIYVLLIGAFFPDHAAWVFMGLYFGGIAVAMVTARLLRRFMFKTDETPFVMELPPYRIPTMRASLRHTWGKAEQYLRKMGGIILVASIVVWALNYFPLHKETAELTPAAVDDSSIDFSRDSYLEMVGKAVNPVMEPLGFTWRATVAAVAGVPAKEIVVSTLGVLYTGDEEVSDDSLAARLKAPDASNGGRPDFDTASALAFMVFILLYCPCIATVTAVVRETGSWKYGLFSVAYNTAVAWLAGLAVYRVALMFV